MEKIITNIQDIKTGDNLLVSGKKWLARTIQAFEGCKYNHSGMFMWIYDILYVIEAERKGIKITPFDEYVKGKADLMILKPEFLVDGSEYGKFMLHYCGDTRYGYSNLLAWQAIRMLSHNRIWFGPNEPDEMPERFICGQWTAFVYYHMTNKEVFWDWPRIAPSDIYNRPEFNHYLFQR
jgi:hypothetical protein